MNALVMLVPPKTPENPKSQCSFYTAPLRPEQRHKPRPKGQKLLLDGIWPIPPSFVVLLHEEPHDERALLYPFRHLDAVPLLHALQERGEVEPLHGMLLARIFGNIGEAPLDVVDDGHDEMTVRVARVAD